MIKLLILKSLHRLKILFFITISFNALNAQIGPTLNEKPHLNDKSEMCGLEEAYKKLYKENPEKKIQDEAVLLKMMQSVDKLNRNGDISRTLDECDTIPVVFHYIYDCGDPDLLAVNAQAFRAIDKLNEDFNGITAQNCVDDTDCDLSFPADPPANRFHFRLADKDPNGNPTIGITKYQSNKTKLGLGNETDYKEIVQWPRKNYLNVYVVEKVTPGGNSGIAHYPTTSHSNELYDGPTIAAWAFDPGFDPSSSYQNYDYMLSHEVGHWLNLHHVWGNNNGPQQCNNCNDDDFAFIGEFLTTYEDLFASDLTNFNDTPNTVGNTIGVSCPIGTNTCPDVGEQWESDICGPVIPEAGSSIVVEDMYDNFMDYTSCATMFSPGQIQFMKLVLNSSIADRNNLISEENLNNCFYLNNEPNMVLMEDAFVEENSSDGCITGEIGIKLRNGLAFHVSYLNQTLDPAFFETTGLPVGLSLNVVVNELDSATLVLTCSGELADHETDLAFQFEMGSNQNPFSTLIQNIDVNNRSKSIRLDFDVFGVHYESLSNENYVGPEALHYQSIPINSFDQIFTGFLIYDNNSDEYSIEISSGMSIFIEHPVIGDPLFVKGFTESLQIDGFVADYDNFGNTYLMDIENLSLDEDGYFYLGFQIEQCDNLKSGWIRFHQEPDCEGVKLVDYAFDANNNDISAGQIEQPVLRMNRSNFEGNSALVFNKINIDLLQTESNQVFCTACNLTNGTDYEIQILEPNYNGINAVNFSLEISESNKAVLSFNSTVAITQNHNVVLLLNNSCFENVSGLNNLEIVIEPSLPENPIYSDFIYNGYENGFNFQSIYIGDENQNTSSNPSQLGFFNYPLSGSSLGGFVFFNPNSNNFKAFSKTTSNELKLFDYLEPIDDGEYKTVGLGYLDGTGPASSELFLSQEYLNTMLGEEKYIALQFLDECQIIYYLWIKIYINSDGSVSLIESLISTETNLEINLGKNPSDGLVCVPQIISDNDFLAITNIEIVDEFLNNSGSNDYTDYTNLGPINLESDQTYTLNLELLSNLSPDHSSGAYWTIWVDFNEDGLYSDNEIVGVYHQEDVYALPFTIDDFSLPGDYASGDYRMRVILSLFPISSGNGCHNITYGEIEDYMISYYTDCIVDKTLEDGLVSGNHQVENFIIMKNYAFVAPNSNVSLKANDYIQILPKTIISKHSTFVAEITPCENLVMKTLEEVKDEQELIVNEIFLNASPNPFNNELVLDFVLLKSEILDIDLFDLNGNQVLSLLTKQDFDSGEHSLKLNLNQLESAVYFIRFKTQNELVVKKIAKVN